MNQKTFIIFDRLDEEQALEIYPSQTQRLSLQDHRVWLNIVWESWEFKLSFSSLQSVWFCVLSPALVLTFRKVSQEGGSEFWAFLLLAYPISTAEVP